MEHADLNAPRVKDMTEGRPLPLIFFFAMPLMLGSFGQQLYMIADTAIVGRGVGVEALAALGATDWLYWMVLWAVQALSQGFSILISQRFGAGDMQGLRQASAMSILLCLLAAVLLSIISVLAAEPSLRLLRTPEAVFEGALSYLRVMCAGTLIVAAYNMASAILRSLGDGRTPLIAMAIAACINIALDLLFVMVFHWGIIGAGVATLIAQLCSFFYCFAVLRRLPLLRLSRSDWELNLPLVHRLCMLGLPMFLQNVLIAVGGMILQTVINGFGFIFVAGMTATNKIYGILESSAISFGYATTTFMAQNYGAGLMDRVQQGIRDAVKLSVLVSVLISVLMIAFGRPLLSLFVSASDANALTVLDIAYSYLFTMACLLFILYLLFAYRSALQGLGDTVSPMISGCIEFLMRVSIALAVLQFLAPWGLSYSIFLAEPGAWTGAAVFLMFSYYRLVRRLLKQHAQSTGSIAKTS